MFILYYNINIKLNSAIYMISGNINWLKSVNIVCYSQGNLGVKKDDDGGSPLLIRKKEKVDGMMSDDEVDSALQKICKCTHPFKRYHRIKEVGAGYLINYNCCSHIVKHFTLPVRLARSTSLVIQSQQERMSAWPSKKLICRNNPNVKWFWMKFSWCVTSFIQI